MEVNYFGPYHGHNEVMFSFFNLINLFLTKHKKVDAHFLEEAKWFLED